MTSWEVYSVQRCRFPMFASFRYFPDNNTYVPLDRYLPSPAVAVGVGVSSSSSSSALEGDYGIPGLGRCGASAAEFIDHNVIVWFQVAVCSMLAVFVVLYSIRLYYICYKQVLEANWIKNPMFRLTALLLIWDLLLIIWYQDPFGALFIFPFYFEFVILWLTQFVGYSIVVFISFELWQSVLKKVHEHDHSFAQDLFKWFVVFQLIVVSFVVSVPVKDLSANGIQILISGIEVAFLGLINLILGMKLRLEMVLQDSSVSKDHYRRPLLKLSILLIGSTVVCAILIIGLVVAGILAVFIDKSDFLSSIATAEELKLSYEIVIGFNCAGNFAVNLSLYLLFPVPWTKESNACSANSKKSRASKLNSGATVSFSKSKRNLPPL